MIVPQLVARVEFIDQLAALAEEVGAEFHEIVLLEDRDAVLRRFVDRGDPEKTLTPQEFSVMYERLLGAVAKRPETKVVQVVSGKAEQAYHDLQLALSTTTSET